VSKTDLLVMVGDGRSGRDDLGDLAAALSSALHIPVQTAYLQATAPSVGEGILDGILEHRPGRVVLLPLFVGASAAQKDNLRQIVDAARDRWRDVTFYEAQPPGVHSGVVTAYDAAVAQSPIPTNETALLVVGRGSRDAGSNAEVYQMARLLWERCPVGAVEAAFHGVTVPNVPTAIKRCVQNGARQIIVVPYVLYDKALYETIRSQAVYSDVEIIVAPQLGIHEGIIEAIRQRHNEALSIASMSHSHGELDVLLPPRYQGGVEVSAAPMAAADLVFDAEGRVAWDEIWGSFCDLALAGGPPHRGTLLEPATPQSVTADPEGYQHVLAELARGIHMITQLPVVASASPGWIGIQCTDEAMALWLLRAIVVENVSVRREGDVLYLPAGPGFRLEYEIKNVITVVAKTHHYWTEHLLNSMGN
jgi:sirohydrochlorin cobaltochelatase